MDGGSGRGDGVCGCADAVADSVADIVADSVADIIAYAVADCIADGGMRPRHLFGRGFWHTTVV